VQQLAQLVSQVTDGAGADVALELSGSPAAFAPGVAALGIGGIYVLAGAVFPQDDVKLNMETVVRRVLTIRGVHNYTAPDLVAAVDFLTTARDLCPWASLVEREFSLEDAQAACEYATREQPLRVAIRA
jgi:alcohol dehydrogenase